MQTKPHTYRLTVWTGFPGMPGFLIHEPGRQPEFPTREAAEAEAARLIEAGAAEAVDLFRKESFSQHRIGRIVSPALAARKAELDRHAAEDRAVAAVADTGRQQSPFMG